MRDMERKSRAVRSPRRLEPLKPFYEIFWTSARPIFVRFQAPFETGDPFVARFEREAPLPKEQVFVAANTALAFKSGANLRE